MITKRIRANARRAGVTLLEVVLASGLLATALGAVAMMSSTTENAYQTASAAMKVEQNLHRALQRAASQLSTTGEQHLFPPSLPEGITFSWLAYQSVEGTNAGAPMSMAVNTN